MLGPLCALLSSVTWVLGSSAYTHLAGRYSPYAVSFNRAAVALPCFALAVWWDSDGVAASLEAVGPALPERLVWLVVSVSASYLLGDALFMMAARRVGYPTAQAIGAVYPVWASLAAFAFMGESLGLSQAAGVVVTSGATAAVIVLGRRERPAGSGAGVFLALFVSLCWALNSFASRQGGLDMHPALANVVRMGYAALAALLVLRLRAGRATPVLLSPREYARYLPLFVTEAFGGSMLYIYGLSHSSTAVGATLSSLSPVLALPLAVGLGWERFSAQKAVAVAAVVAGVVLLVNG